jgi:spermidine synthase
MAADLVIIFAFQTLYGYVYQWVALLITAFMAGLSLGGLLMTRKLTDLENERSLLVRIELTFILYWALLPITLGVLNTGHAHPLMFALSQVALFLFSGVAGFLVGAQFPLANSLWLRGGGDHKRTGGLLYACDLVGAFLSSILVSVILVPALGILETCVLAGLLKLGSFLLVTRLPTRVQRTLKI